MLNPLFSHNKKYGIARANTRAWIGRQDVPQLSLYRGDQVIDDAWQIEQMANNHQYCLKGEELHRDICFDLEGLLSEHPIYGERLTNRLPDDISGANILILRHGGLGDVICIQSLARWLNLAGASEVGFACGSTNAVIPAGNKWIDAVIPLPCRIHELRKYDYILCWDGGVERDELMIDGKRLGGAYLWAHHANIKTDSEDKIPIELSPVKSRYHRRKMNRIRREKGLDKVVVLNYCGSRIINSYPYEMLLKTAWLLTGHCVVIVSAMARDLQMTLQQHQVETLEKEGIIFATDQSVKTTEDWLCMLSQADLLISVDSASLHWAYHAGIRSIGLFCQHDARQWYSVDSERLEFSGKCEYHPCRGGDTYHLGFPCINPAPSGYPAGYYGITPYELKSEALRWLANMNQ